MTFKELLSRQSTFGFMQRFAPLVASGKKTTTIRKPQHREPKCGDLVKLWTWSGQPRHSEQWLLGYGVAVRVETIGIEEVNGHARLTLFEHAMISGWMDDDFLAEPEFRPLYRARKSSTTPLRVDNQVWANGIANKDGFTTAWEMLEWFREMYGTPFIGTNVEWLPITESRMDGWKKPEVFALPRFAKLAQQLQLDGVGKRL